MANPVLVAAPVAIVPAIGALWYLLKRYELYFEDARVFFSLTVGFFAGLVTVFLEFQVFGFQQPDFIARAGWGTAAIMFVAGYALLETAAKLVVLGSKGYRSRKDTPYYGAALGLGMGAMMSLGFIAINLNASEALAAASQNLTAQDTAYRPVPFVAMALLPVGAILAHGGAGVYIGRSTARGEIWMGWLIGTLLQAPVLLAYLMFWPSIGYGNVVVIAPGLLSFAYGAGLLHIARKKVLDTIVPKEILDRVRREQRRQARRREEE